ncbi:MAG: nuclear transport factor 2 family protein [Sphingomonadaceae bacterium]|nr:nuclear transport factor 2 family protein [Sphingomonadaceae bacterium]
MARAAFNTALAAGDLAAIRPLLAPDCVLVTGTDSAVLSGRKAQLAAWKAEFAARVRTTYVRTPETVTVSAVEPIALETGRWEGLRDGAREAGGNYSAKWREVGGSWVLEAEIFVTL